MDLKQTVVAAEAHFLQWIMVRIKIIVKKSLYIYAFRLIWKLLEKSLCC